MERIRALFDAHVQHWLDKIPAGELHAPMAYMMQLPAKRVRPTLTLLACELFGGNANNVLDEALGIELFHNFTLMHDDIMDNSTLRRGMPTVHEKWNANTAILSGDAMLVRAYQVMGSDPHVLAIFNRNALEVCEGQQLDMEFQQRDNVTLDEYREMIRLKTAVLLDCALRIGACKAGASEHDQELIGAFGEQLGLAFQLRDDLLDAFGETSSTGKEQGGDLRNGKKTWLLISALQRAEEANDATLRNELAKPIAERDVARMIRALQALGVQRDAELEAQRLETAAFKALDAIGQPDQRKLPLRQLAEALRGRVS